jgi:uncharacterized protein (DUF4415 family)
MNNGRITSMTRKEMASAESLTDWDRLQREAQTDDAPSEDDPEDGFDWSVAVVIQRPLKEPVSIRLDDDVLSFFKAGGKGYQSRINAVLRSYMQAKTTAR